MPELLEETVVVTRRSPQREKRREKQPTGDQQRRRQPRYHVILWDDNDHTYQYVIRMMRKLFGHSKEQAFRIAHQVDTAGKAVCLTTTLEHAELKRDQVHAFGKDGLIESCAGSMSCTIEPEPEE